MFRDQVENVQTLLDAFASVPISGGSAVFVSGEAGIGKSTLIDHFLAALDPNHRRAVAMCDPLNTPRPLGPIRDLKRAIVGTPSQALEDDHLFESFLQLLQNVDAPLLLVIEDLHWVDQRSLDWLQFLGRRLSQLPVLLVGSYRNDEVDAFHPLSTALASIPTDRKSELVLGPLSLETIREMVVGSGFEAENLLDVTGGNPFYLTELLNNDDSDRSVPRSVSDAVNARLNRLDPEHQRFIEIVSCCPNQFSYDLIKEMQPGDIAPLFDEATHRKILVPTGSNYKFRHEIARLAAYERMSPAARREAHELFLDALLRGSADDETVDLIVHHAQGAFRQDLVRRYGPVAAKIAARLGAHKEAAQYLKNVMDVLDGQPATFSAEIYETWAYEAALALAIDDTVIDARLRAVELWREVGDAERVGENLRWLSRLHWYRGEADTAQRFIHEAIELLEGEELSSARAKAYGLRAQFFMLQDRMDNAIEWGEKAYNIANQTNDMELVAHALNTIGTAKMFRGDPTGEAQLRDSLKVSLEQGFHEQAARVYTNLSECLVEARDLAAAADLIEEGIAFDTAHDLDSWTYYLVGRKAHLFFEQDRYPEALTIAQGVLERENQTILMRMPAIIIEARCKLRLGDSDAVAVLEAAMAAAEKIGEPQYLVTLRIAQLEAAVLAGDVSAATSAQTLVEGLTSDQLSPRKRGEYLFWSQLAGLSPQAEFIDELPMAFQHVLVGCFDGASKAFISEQSDYLAAWMMYETQEPSEVLQADEIFERIGAVAARKTIRSQANGSPTLSPLKLVVRGPYHAARQHPYGLTKSEQVVLAMLANGKSNAGIAQAQSRSQRTIENHVSSILSKLRCKNRLEVVLRVQSEPWLVSDTPT